tara:strand:+ start:1042 stop:1737 length:696 start_codon:yes stop_codon:yes gene_type:complete
MKNKYIILAVIIFSFSCETEDVAPINPNDPVDPTEILGCTDPNAVNYNSDANTDDGCCQYNNLLLNEVLYDPSNSGLDGDANGDGEYVHNDDEFVELVNVSNSNLDISGYEFYDNANLMSGMPNHIVPPGTVLPPMKAYVVFGGGNPTGDFGGAIVHTASASVLNLNNSSDTLTIKNDIGETIIVFDIEALSNNPNESYSRLPDICGDFVQHNSTSLGLFSPGTKSNGDPF